MSVGLVLAIALGPAPTPATAVITAATMASKAALPAGGFLSPSYGMLTIRVKSSLAMLIASAAVGAAGSKPPERPLQVGDALNVGRATGPGASSGTSGRHA